jgi:restriction system protein
MTIPTHEDAMLPVLNLLRDGQAYHRRVLADAMAEHFQLTQEERVALLPSGKSPVIRSRTGWALSYMKQARLVESPRRGWYQITDLGQQTLAAKPARIDNEYLLRFDGFRDFRARSKAAGVEGDDAAAPIAPTASVVSSAGQPPDEALEEAYARLRSSVEAELLDAVKQAAPSFFEELVVDLLVKMGYGGSRAEAARAIGRSGDGGIDGVIDEDRLGLDVIYIQAKRWEGSVGRPEIQKFAGALQGQRASKGIFLTTSSYTREAEEYAQRIGTRIVLVDGRRLVSLMFEYDVGVSARNTYTVKTIDGDYFEES